MRLVTSSINSETATPMTNAQPPQRGRVRARVRQKAANAYMPVGGPFASVLFGIALLASGQSSTFTGTIKQLMGPFVNRWSTRVLVWGLFVVISAANSWLILQLLA